MICRFITLNVNQKSENRNYHIANLGKYPFHQIYLLALSLRALAGSERNQVMPICFISRQKPWENKRVNMPDNVHLLSLCVTR